MSRDMLKSDVPDAARKMLLVIELMRQFYDEERVYRITGESGGVEYVPFSNAMLQAVPGGNVGGVQLGDHEPVFDITVSAAKKSTFSRLSQNETAKECYQLGFFAPANADAALAALEMMDFEGIEKVRERVSQNGTLYQQLQQMAQADAERWARPSFDPAETAPKRERSSQRGRTGCRCCRNRGAAGRGREEHHQQSGRCGGRKREQQHGDPGRKAGHGREQPEQVKEERHGAERHHRWHDQ